MLAAGLKLMIRIMIVIFLVVVKKIMVQPKLLSFK